MRDPCGGRLPAHVGPARPPLGRPLIRGDAFGPPVPILRSFDEGRARAFWIDWLGFAVDWEHRFEPTMPLYMQIHRGSCVIHLSEHHGDATPGSAIRVRAPDLDGLLAELRGRPVSFSRPAIEDQSWGAREIRVQDPFGNRIMFWAPSNPG